MTEQAKKINLAEKNLIVEELPSLKDIIIFAFPQLIIMLSYLVLSLTDLWVAGKLGSAVQASLGIVAQVNMILMLSLSFFVSGFSTTIAQCLGARKNLRASRYIVSAIGICISVGGFIAILGIILSGIFLNFLAISDKELEKIVYTFIVAYSCKLPFMSIKIQINSTFRAYKKTRVPVMATLLICITNFICSLGFGLGAFGFPDYGYAGIAWSTVFAAIVGCLYLFFEVWRAKILSRKSFVGIRWNRRALPYVFSIGIPTATASLISQSGTIIIMSIMLSFSGTTNAVIAGYTLGSQVQSILHFILGAFTISVSVLAGRLMGARKYDAIYELGVRTARFSFILSIFFALMTYFYGTYVVNILTEDAKSRSEALYFLQFACIMQPFHGINSILHGVFGGVGASRVNASIAAFTSWCVNIPIAYIFGIVLNFGIIAIYSSYVISAILSSILLVYIFYARKWENYGLIKKKK